MVGAVVWIPLPEAKSCVQCEGIFAGSQVCPKCASELGVAGVRIAASQPKKGEEIAMDLESLECAAEALGLDITQPGKIICTDHSIMWRIPDGATEKDLDEINSKLVKHCDAYHDEA